MSKQETKVTLNKETKILFLKALKDGFINLNELGEVLGVVIAKSQVTIFELPDNGRD